VIFAWRRVPQALAAAAGRYALMMAFSLVYTAEHYVVDVLAGLALAWLVSGRFARRERREALARNADPRSRNSKELRPGPASGSRTRGYGRRGRAPVG